MPGGRTCENGKIEVEANKEEEKKEEENVDIESKGEEILNTKAIQIEKTEEIETPAAVIIPETAASSAVISASDIKPIKAIPVDVKPIQVNWAWFSLLIRFIYCFFYYSGLFFRIRYSFWFLFVLVIKTKQSTFNKIL